MIKRITPRNFLSFGPDNDGIEMESLNVLIGPNGSGKSNLIEAIHFMRSAPKDLREATRRGGGVSEMIWKGARTESASVELQIDEVPNAQGRVRHLIEFQSISQSFQLKDERIEEVDKRNKSRGAPYFFYRFQEGKPTVNTKDGRKRDLVRETIEQDRSILAQRRDPEAFPELAHIANEYEKMRIFREWSFGQTAQLRRPQAADVHSTPLEEDFSNLALFLNRMQAQYPKAKRQLLEELRNL